MRLQPRAIADQVVVVVGASSGIGRETAMQLSQRGATLVVSSRDETALWTLREDAIARGAKDVLIVVADASDADQMRGLAQRTVEWQGRLDAWVHVAGVDLWATFEDTAPAEFRRVVEIDLLGPAYGAMAALPELRASDGGSLVVVSSVEADVPLPYQSAYTAAKHGVDGFVRSLRMELRREGAPIAVTQVKPSGIDTPLFAASRSLIGVEPKPVAPVYDPSVVAELIVHALERPESRDLYAGGAGWAMAIADRLAPGLTERVLSLVGQPMQRSSEPNTALRPDSLDGPASGSAIRDGHGGRAISIGNRVQMAPLAARLGMLAGVVGLAAMLLRWRTDGAGGAPQ